MYTAIIEHLQNFFASEQAEARRVFHGRGQRFPGLEHIVIDWYGPVLLIGAYKPIPDVEPLLQAALQADALGQIKSVVLQHRKTNQSVAETLWGESIAETNIEESGLRFEVHPGNKQNAGFFLDMRPLRRWLLENSAEKSVLNLFSYTCSFSVAALAGGASSVCSVDMSKTSIAWGERNHRLNAQDMRRVRSVPHNLFRSWGKIKQYGRYDIIIIDPPSRQRGSFDVEKNYGAVIKKLGQLAQPNAEIIATLNSPFLPANYLLDRFARYAPQCQFLETMPASPEFTDINPEQALKIFRFRSRSKK